MPKSCAVRSGVSANDAPTPIAIPIAASVTPWATTRRSTDRGCAPSARRMPISDVRSDTVKAITP
jgi:hypothetical protein